MDRRDFLVRGALGAGALTLARCGGAKGAEPATPAPAGTPATWEAIRAEFPADPALVHMTSFFLVSHPRVVRDAIERHRQGLDANPFGYIEGNIAALEGAVTAAAAGYLGTDADSLAMTDSTTQGLGLVYGGLELRPDQEILTTPHDHIVTHMAVGYRAARAGAKVKRVTLYDAPATASVDEIAGRLERALTAKTRVVATTWVHSGTGVKLPIRAMADVIARANASRDATDRALLVVDGVHGFGNQDFTVDQLGCDVFVAGCHKWMFGPRGTGLVWARPAAWKATGPIIPSMSPMFRSEPLDKIPLAAWMSPGGFHSFEHRWALDAAFGFHQQIGKAKIAARIAELNTRCKDALAALPGITLVTPRSPELSAGIICFSVTGKTPAQAVEHLLGRGIVASVTPSFYDPAYVRLAPSLLTLEADVDRAVAAVAAA